MNKYIVVLLILLTGFAGTDVRREVIVLDWQTSGAPGNQLGLTFPRAGYDSRAPQIPRFFKSYPAEGPGSNILFVLENPVFEPVETNLPAAVTNNLKSEPEIKKTTILSGENYQIEIQIPAVIRREGETLLLKKFELKQIPVQEKSAFASSYEWETASKLKEGKWVKISTEEKGIYMIPWSKLSAWGFSNPAAVKVFGAGGLILSENPGTIAYDDIPQIAVWHGRNNGTDCLFFYAPGSTEWSPAPSGFEHRLHPYSTKGHFFLSEEAGTQKNIEKYAGINKTPTHTITAFDDFLLHETEQYNLIHSGRQWFGDKFTHGTTRNYSFQIRDADPLSDLSVRINSAARSSTPSEMLIMAGQDILGRIHFSSVNTSDNTSWFADEKSDEFSLSPPSGDMELALRFAASGPNPEAWIDFAEINFRRKLKPAGNEVLFFRDKNSTGEGNILEFTIESATPGLKVWDVTDVFNVKEVPLQYGTNTAKGIRPASSLREYAAFDPGGDFPEPELVGEVTNQNLHGLATPEFLIITSPAFINQANELADFHRTYDGMEVEVVTTTGVYNEFSSGNKDATGIRNCIKMFYDRQEGLKYVLLFGDGSYDNKNIHPESTAFIPTFQSAVSLDPVGSFVSDDYFVLLNPGESVYNGAVDLGIGRIPASTPFQANLMVNKIKNYHAPEALGDWRNVICFIADDEDNNLHMIDSERLSQQMDENHREFLVDKIYFDAFRQISGPGGESYPDATDAINQRVKEGVLILNYVGHANERFLAHEKVLDISHINSWSNAKKLPIFVTATCEFSRFDADDTSAGEYILFNPNGGGIGLFSTTRLVFAYSNFLLSRNFYRFVFSKDQNDENYRMGDIMRLAKINTINTTNKRNFSLLTDPALKLSWPKHRIVTSTVNGHPAYQEPDTIGALQKITISGFVADEDGNRLTNFNGEVIPMVFSQPTTIKTRGNGGEEPMEFDVQENIIYKGQAKVVDGEFSFSFVVPKDISYNPGEGKIIYYAQDGNEDAHGAFENFMVGGPASQTTDNQGPEIEIFMDSRQFIPGGTVSSNPVLLADLYDANGINTVGSGIGHDITAVLNDDYSNIMILNEYYQANEGDFTSGTIRFPLKNLPEGKHRLRLKAWDVANNSTETEIEFTVTGAFSITRVKNYPNPVYDHTFFTFEHNQADATLEAIFEVFDQNGRRIDYFSREVGSNGNISNPVRWDLNESNVLLRGGIYIFRITAQNGDGIITSHSGKLIVAR